MKPKKKRKYFRKCGTKLEQSDMVRDLCSTNGWTCKDCKWKRYPEYEIEFEDI